MLFWRCTKYVHEENVHVKKTENIYKEKLALLENRNAKYGGGAGLLHKLHYENSFGRDGDDCIIALTDVQTHAHTHICTHTHAHTYMYTHTVPRRRTCE